ncbi:MAG: asparagine synthetase B family protein [Candidatus Marinimicrobia bacterium]|nr:asparagine synthetase B family protein [Candidatus Neomarinimicrobiota bacterium]
MSTISNPIIPIKQEFYDICTNKIVNWDTNSNNYLDLKALASFCSLGFMLDDDTFSKRIKVCKPATDYQLDENKNINGINKKWEWHYKPTERSFKNTLNDFKELFSTIIKTETINKSILLPISGGLDSRTLFVPISDRKNVVLASYDFEGGFHESETGKILSKQFNIPYYAQKIQRGYLWQKLDEISHLNNCMTDFNHPRQVDAIPHWKGLADVILLGHWGDVLFDKHTESDKINYDYQLIHLKNNILKSGGCELADDLWRIWSLEGTFDAYMMERLDKLYSEIDIDHPSARIRAFKSLYWAPRWTSINLSLFNQVGEIVIPYYSDEMCKFICTVPERHLADRKIQIEYVKKQCHEAARIPWQKYYPLNLYNYQRFNHPHYYLVRAVRKAKRILGQYFSKSPDLITRNWELQFLGKQNIFELKKNLLERKEINKLIPQNLIRKYLDKFQVNPVKYAHPISMLLTLAVFSDRHYQE